MFDWNQDLHPRDLLGEFEDHLGAMPINKSTTTSDHITIKKMKRKVTTGEKRSQYDRFRTHVTTHAVTVQEGPITRKLFHEDDLHETIRRVMDHSAKSEHPKSTGGSTSFKDFADYEKRLF